MLGREHRADPIQSPESDLSLGSIGVEKPVDEKTEYHQSVARNLLLNDLSYFHSYAEDLEEYKKYFGEKFDIEIIEAAKDAQRIVLMNNEMREPQEILTAFNDLSKAFGLSPQWQDNSTLVEAVKIHFVVTIERCYEGFHQLNHLKSLFGDPVIINDAKLRQILAERVLYVDARLKDKYTVLTDWGLSAEELKAESFKNITEGLFGPIIFSRSLEDKVLRLLGEFVEVWPEILDLPGLKDTVCHRINTLTTVNLLGENLNRAILDFEILAEILELPADFVAQWQVETVKKVATLSGMSLDNRFRMVSRCQRSFVELGSKWDEVIKEVLTDFLCNGRTQDYELFSRKFNQVVEITPEEIKTYAEKSVRELLQTTESNTVVILSRLAQQQEAFHLPGEFFQQKEIFNKVVELMMSEYLEHVDSEKIKSLVHLFGLQPSVFSEMDQKMSLKELPEHKLSNFLMVIDAVEDQTLFPRTLAKIKQIIIDNLPTDESLAVAFITNFNSLKKDWARENILSVISQPAAANAFLNWYEKDKRSFVWTGEPRLGEVVKKANRVTSDFIQEKVKKKGRKGLEKYDMFENSYARFGATDPVLVDKIKKFLAGTDTLPEEETRPIKIIKDQRALKVAKASTRELREWQTDVDDAVEVETDVDDLNITPQAREKLLEIKKAVDKAHEDFLSRFINTSGIPEADKLALISNGEGGAFKMNNLLPNVRAFVGRFIVQMSRGQKELLNTGILETSLQIETLLEQGFNKYLGVYKSDILLYDILYEEFDSMRVAGRKPREVYLGRDGIYAYIGRRAQEAMRLVKENKEVKDRIGTKKGDAAIKPLYLVYPSYFRDVINYETKKAFLEQERVGPDHDPIFFDTGFAGSIPEQIMQIMGFSREEVERRIKLLSTRVTKRRVRGIEVNSSLVNDIEDNPKTERTASGLVRDSKTGLIRHIAAPATATDQFLFSMIKQAIARHYMVKEAAHSSETQNVSLDFENRSAVLNKDYATLVPQEFMVDPESFLRQFGQRLIKEGDEPTELDTEIFSWKLSDGTEIFVKSTSPYQTTKDAHGEFVLLNMARQRGLPAAEPVGFLAGKKEGDKSYLLMKKVVGIPGDELERYLSSANLGGGSATKIMERVVEENQKLAALYRKNAKIDKVWLLEDLIVNINPETGRIEGVVPIDWSEIVNYDPSEPKNVSVSFKPISA